MPSGLLKADLMHQLEFSRSLGCPKNKNSRTSLYIEFLLWKSKQEETSFDIMYMVRERTVMRANLHLPNPVAGECSVQITGF